MAFSHLAAALEARRAAALWRQRQTLATAQGPQVIRDRRTLHNFSSNDYLGLANDRRVIEALAQGAREFGAGGGASPLVNGHLLPHHALEARLAELTGRPRTLLFPSGYMANLGVLQALLTSRDDVFQDRLNHASLLDGARLAGARQRRFHHRDLQDLERLLSRRRGREALVVSDGVFSMDGDVADVAGLAALAKRFDAWLMIDDAHGLGVLGTYGDGCAGQRFPVDDVPVLVGTLGKALGTSGAFVAGSAVLIDTLIQQARPYIYTTAESPAVASATLTALDIVAQEPQRRQRLTDHVARFRQGASRLGLPLLTSHTPIQPLLLGSAERALAWSRELERRGFLVSAIREPTVPRGSARLRITLSATHEPAAIDALLEALARIAADDALAPTGGAQA
ncbi:8-amino-7-oxononanoate synthase [Halomonas shantousis]